LGRKDEQINAAQTVLTLRWISSIARALTEASVDVMPARRACGFGRIVRSEKVIGLERQPSGA
jgi:hypothetical protein